MAENETVTQEAQPKYRKSAQWFAVGVVALLALVLMIDTFRRSGRQQKESDPLPVDQQQDARQNGLDFERRFNQEIKRRQLQKPELNDRQIKRDSAKKILEKNQALQQRPDEFETQPEKEPSPYEQWKDKEKRRALEARQAGFALKQPGGVNRTKMPTYQPGQTEKGNNFEPTEEQKRVMAEIKRLEMMQKGAEAASQQKPTGNLPLPFDKVQAEPITVGQPQSEAAPKAGQKLMPTGTIIGAVLDQRLMSDYTGPFRALITQDVYDVSDKYILIPKGSRVIGRSLRITNVNEPIQARMGLIVKWLVLPNGKRITFEKRVAALDQAGVPAIKDQVNYHFLAQFMGVAAYALLASSTSYNGSGWADDKTFEGNLGQSLREQFSPLAAKYLNLVPTITLREGTPLKIFVEDDIYAFPWEAISNRLFRVNRTG